MTDDDVIKELLSNSPLNQARREFNKARGKIERAYAQKHPPSPVDVRRMEFEAVKRIIKVLQSEDPAFKCKVVVL